MTFRDFWNLYTYDDSEFFIYIVNDKCLVEATGFYTNLARHYNLKEVYKVDLDYIHNTAMFYLRS